jgi:hypothetical protein
VIITKEELQELTSDIEELFYSHAGCIEPTCHCGGDPIEFEDNLAKVLYKYTEEGKNDSKQPTS